MTTAQISTTVAPLPEGYFWRFTIYTNGSLEGATFLELMRKGFWGVREVANDCAVSSSGSFGNTEGQMLRSIVKKSFEMRSNYFDQVDETKYQELAERLSQQAGIQEVRVKRMH